ncbi:PorV/PorQ family protein [bacterium]|nr:PorV/PorQ family protein [bacterium]
MTVRLNSTLLILSIIVITVSVNVVQAQEPYRQGTTAANFLEIGFGSAGTAMGDAYVSMANDISSVFWNPAGLGFMNRGEAEFNYQPIILDINAIAFAAGMPLENVGSFAINYIQMDYGRNEVTTMEMQDGTGELFNATEFAIGFSFARNLAQWFSFGATAKYISSQIWQTSANAFAIDLGVIIQTEFFSRTGKRGDGMNIGMSISNFGTKMRYMGDKLLNPIDILPDEAGNYQSVPGMFKTEGWELPLLFRVGVSVNPIVTEKSRFSVSLDAVHPNNNSESVNVGGQYKITMPTGWSFFLRGGYKALFMVHSEYGFSFGGGFVMNMMHGKGLKIEYSYRELGILGNIQTYNIGLMF